MKSSTNRGVFNALMSGMLWGADTSLTGVVLLMLPFTLVDSRLAAASLLLAFFHDAFSHFHFIFVYIKTEGSCYILPHFDIQVS